MSEPTPSTPKRTLGEFLIDAWLGIFHGTFADHWFKWVEWVLVTAALYVLGVEADSEIVKYLAYISAILAMFNVLHHADTATDRLVESARGLRWWVRLFVAFAMLAFTLAVARTLLEFVGVALSPRT